MRTRTSRLLLAICVTLAGVQQVGAVVQTFTDRSAWEAAVGAFTEETFDGFSTDQSFNNGASVDVGDFTLTGWAYSFPPAESFDRIDVSPFSSLVGSLNGTTDLAVRVARFAPLAPNQWFKITFDQPIFAWGADWGGTASSFRVEAGGRVIGFGQDNGFFGFVDTMAAFTAMRIDKPWTGIRGAATTTMDNFVYSEPVPEPATVALCLLALGGLGLAMRRRTV